MAVLGFFLGGSIKNINYIKILNKRELNISISQEKKNKK